MTIQGKIGTYTRNDDRARADGHGPVALAGKLKADDGVYPAGLLLTRGIDGVLVPLADVSGEVIGTGDGAQTDFTGTLGTGLPVEPGTVSITDGTETFTDDGCGRLAGDAGGSGTVNYKTAAYSVSFNAAPSDGADITAGYTTALAGVLDEDTDTAVSGAGLYIVHGTCRQDMLKVGKTDKAAPGAALLAMLAGRGIYAV